MITHKLKVGSQEFNSDTHLNFRINTWYAQGCLSFDDAKTAGSRIQSFEDWKREFQKLGDLAILDDRLLDAAFCYRIAEFHTPHVDPDKSLLYRKFQDYYYQAIDGSGIEKHLVPYEDTFLPALFFPAKGEVKGTYLIHGGYDSCIEDFHNTYHYLCDQGYEIYAFEGPGQGNAIHTYHLPMITEWEKPVSAVLDYFQLNDVTLVGVSLGGYLALRAAAFEPRIKRVILWDIIWDMLGAILTSGGSEDLKDIVFDMLDKNNKLKFKIFEKKMLSSDGSVFMLWLYQHGRFIFQVDTLFDFLKKLKEFSTEEFSPLVKQHVLLLGGEDDIYTMYFEEQKNALTKAASVEGRIFTRAENASTHCQIGNLPLVLDYMLDWTDRVKKL